MHNCTCAFLCQCSRWTFSIQSTPLFRSKPHTHPRPRDPPFPPPGHSRSTEEPGCQAGQGPASSPLYRMLSVLLPSRCSSQGRREEESGACEARGRNQAQERPGFALCIPLRGSIQESHCALGKPELATDSEAGFVQLSLTR